MVYRCCFSLALIPPYIAPLVLFITWKIIDWLSVIHSYFPGRGTHLLLLPLMNWILQKSYYTFCEIYDSYCHQSLVHNDDFWPFQAQPHADVAVALQIAFSEWSECCIEKPRLLSKLVSSYFISDRMSIRLMMFRLMPVCQRLRFGPGAQGLSLYLTYLHLIINLT